MPATKVSDIIVPEVFVPYVIERTAELSALVQSGIVVPDEGLDELARKGGVMVQMPFFSDLTGADEVLSDAAPLTVGKIGTGKDVARLHMRGKAWGVNDLARALSGADPMNAIANLVAMYWNRREQALLISTLKGVFLDNSLNDSGDLISDIAIDAGAAATDANLIGGEAIIDAAAKLGDAAGGLTAIAMHSVPFTRLQKLQLIDWIEVNGARAENGADAIDRVPTILGKRIIVDDTCPVEAGATSGFKYTSFLFGPGAIGRGEGAAPVPTETDRDSLSGEDILIHRRHFILHPRGIKWVETSVAGESPTNIECELDINWDRVYEKKNIRLVQMVTNG